MSILYTQSLGDLERNKFIENGDVSVKVTTRRYRSSGFIFSHESIDATGNF